jgi:hypothetical protein
MSNPDPWALTYEDDTATPTDERLAFELLCGVPVHIPNTPLRTIYPTGQEEQAARAALARLIRKGSSFPGFIRETLAGMFDPASATVPIERRIEFKRLRTGPSAELALMVAMHVCHLQWRGEKKEMAVQSAAERFCLKRSRVFAICRKHALDLPFPKTWRKRKSPIK